MTYTSSIDNITSKRWGLNLSEAYLFSFIFYAPTWCELIMINSNQFYFLSRTKVVEQLSFFDKTDTVYRLFKSLEKKGVIIHKKVGQKDAIKITKKGLSWNQIKPVENSEKFPNSEKNPEKLGKKSEKTRKNFRKNSEKNPTYNNTINNSTIDKEKIYLSPKEMYDYITPIINKKYFHLTSELIAEYGITVIPKYVRMVLDNYAETDQWVKLQKPKTENQEFMYITSLLARVNNFLRNAKKWNNLPSEGASKYDKKIINQ